MARRKEKPAEPKRFRVGYSVKWNFNGSLEVEARTADDAEKQARARLDKMADEGRFDDPLDFKEMAEFDRAIILGTEEAEDYRVERQCAQAIAEYSCRTIDGEEAAKAVAEAVVTCRAHPVVCLGDGIISFDYDNSFGPTVTVDDVLDRMNMRDWRMACDWFCKLMLQKGGYDPEEFDWPTPLPKVMKIPEDAGTDVTARVCVTFKVDKETYRHILFLVNGKGEDKDETAAAAEEETCTNCDHVIRYIPEKGKRVVTCPECGTINPLCNECEPSNKRCGECAVSVMCEELNKMRAESCVGKEEE